MLEELHIIGYTLAGTPVFDVFGGDGEDDDENSTDDENTDDDGEGSADGGDSDDDKLGNAGKRALDRERDKAKKARTDLKPWAALSREFGTPEQIREKLAGKSNEDVEAVRTEGNARIDKMRENIAKLAVRAHASDFIDPDDAVRFVDLSSIEVDEDGTVDADEIAGELASVLERKPHLRKSADGDNSKQKKKLPNPDKSQGNGSGNKGASTLDAGRDRYERLFGKKKQN